MSFRRIPFQFSTTDPVERQLELERRFGLPTSKEMYIDVTNPVSMVTRNKDFSSSSPRLQHRVPIFVEGHDQPIKACVDSINVCSEKKPNVRVIPIEVEGADTQLSTRHRTFSGPAGITQKDEYLSRREDTSSLKRSMQDLSQPSKVKSTTCPRVHNIPIKIEGKDFNKTCSNSEKVIKSSKKDYPKTNACAVSKPTSKTKSPEKGKNEQREKCKPDYNTPLKKIESILEELKSYESGVQEFSGTMKDKQYRYLDEMLTRCMLRLDDIDTMGNESIRFTRKSAVKKVQAYIDLLETKVNPQGDVKVKELEQELKFNNVDKDVNMKEITNGELKQKDMDKQLQSAVLNTQEQSSLIEMKDDEDEKVLLKTELPEVRIDVNEVEMIDNKEATNNVPEIEMSDNVCLSQNTNLETEVEMKELKDSDVPHITSQNSSLEDKQDVLSQSAEVNGDAIEMKDLFDKEDGILDIPCTETTSILNDHSHSVVYDNISNKISIENKTENLSKDLKSDIINLELKNNKTEIKDNLSSQNSVASEVGSEKASGDLQSELKNFESESVSKVITNDLCESASS